MHLSAGRWYASAFMFPFSELEGIPLLMEIIGERCILMNVQPAAEQEQLDQSEQTPLPRLAYCTYERTPGSVIAGNSQ